MHGSHPTKAMASQPQYKRIILTDVWYLKYFICVVGLFFFSIVCWNMSIEFRKVVLKSGMHSLWTLADKCSDFCLWLWQNLNAKHLSTILTQLIFFLSGCDLYCRGKSRNIDNLLKSCSLSYLYNLLCQWFWGGGSCTSSPMNTSQMCWKFPTNLCISFHSFVIKCIWFWLEEKNLCNPKGFLSLWIIDSCLSQLHPCYSNRYYERNPCFVNFADPDTRKDNPLLSRFLQDLWTIQSLLKKNITSLRVIWS